jgi:hypothetical protein
VRCQQGHDAMLKRKSCGCTQEDQPGSGPTLRECRV